MIIYEWVLFNVKWAIFQLYYGKNILQLHFNEMLCFYSTTLLKKNNPVVDTLSWSRAYSLCSYSLMLCAYWRSSTYQFHSIFVTRPVLEPTICHTRGEDTTYVHYLIVNLVLHSWLLQIALRKVWRYQRSNLKE